MNDPVAKRNVLFKYTAAFTTRLANSERWLVVLLGLSILWPWLNTWFWEEFMETLLKDWLGSNLGWGRTVFAGFVVGLCIWPVFLALACWAVLQHREQGRHYPIFLLVLAFAQIVALAAITSGRWL
jgi:hypothetical protein